MSTVLGLIGIAFFIVSVISLAAAVTWAVVRITPSREKKAGTVEAEATPQG